MKLLMICFLVYTVLAGRQLTTDDFYQDPGAPVELNKTDDDDSTILTLPLNISNIIGNSSIVSDIGVRLSK